MYIIGLTGNIATGKSTVAAMLASLGACVIDADELAHWAMRPGTDTNRRIVERFGTRMLGQDGEINRAELASLVFADPVALRDLEAIVHPVVVAETLRRLAVCERPVAVVEAIKLLEAQMHTHCDAIWVVTCNREQQVERLVSMRHLTVEQAELRIGAQPPASAKVKRAHVVIDNSRGLAETWTQVLRAWSKIPGAPSVPEDTPWPELAGGNAGQPGGRPGGRQGTQKQAILGGARWVSALRAFCSRHQWLVSWPILSVGMTVLMLWAAQDRGLSPWQLAWLVVACIGLAGVCARIIAWE